jgi:hypothetical protein
MKKTENTQTFIQFILIYFSLINQLVFYVQATVKVGHGGKIKKMTVDYGIWYGRYFSEDQKKR